MRLYRGLKGSHDPAGVPTGRLEGTDFTDCPLTALMYANVPKGVLLVLDVPDGAARVTEELWLGVSAKRLMLWGPFDRFIVAQIPAKEMRAEVRRKGIVTASFQYKSDVLRRVISERFVGG